MKKLILILILSLPGLMVFACPACEKQQPKILRGIAHGAGPKDNWDYLIVWATVFIVLFTLYFSIKFLVKPGEKSANHIKRAILNG